MRPPGPRLAAPVLLVPMLLTLVVTASPVRAQADEAPSPYIDCWAAEESALDTVVCDDPMLRAWDDALADRLVDRPGVMRALRDELARACGMAGDDAVSDAIQRLERAGCLAPRYRAALATHGIAADAPPERPADEVHPLCLGMAHALWGEPEIAELPMETCRLGTAHIPVTQNPDGTRVAEGLSIGQFTFVAYTPLGLLQDGRSTALIQRNTGGTGVFSAVVAFTTGPTLTVETLVQGGDRCNGGITAARRDGPDWIVAFDITPFDIAEVIGAGDAAGTDALSSCAICCAAELEIRFPPEGDGEVLSLIPPDPKGASEWTGEAETCLFAALGTETIPVTSFPPVRARFEGCLKGGEKRAP